MESESRHAYTVTTTISFTGVTHPAQLTVYESVRTANDFSYLLPGFTPSASYTVRLHFADYWVANLGGRNSPQFLIFRRKRLSAARIYD